MFKILYFKISVGKEVVFKDALNDEEIYEIRNCISVLDRYLSLCDYFLMVIDNCNDFIIDSITNGPGNADGFIRANRLLLNALNSYYVWQVVSKSNALNGEHKMLINTIKNKGVLELANRIRNKYVHNGALVSEMTFDLITEKTSIILNIDKVFSQKDRDSFNKKIRGYLSGPSLDMIVFIKDFLNSFLELNKTIGGSIEEVYNQHIHYLATFTPNTAPDCYNTYALDEEIGDVINIGRILELLTTKNELIIDRIQGCLSKLNLP